MFFDNLGFQYEELMQRFLGNDMLANRFLKTFVDEKTYVQLCSAIEQENYQDIENLAHTLKGIAGNLGLKSIFEDSDRIVKTIRMNQYEKVQPSFEQLQQDYHQVVEVLKQLD